jgi:hypothetical protein
MDEITVTAHLPWLDVAISRIPHPSGNGEELLTIGVRPSLQLGPLGEEMLMGRGLASFVDPLGLMAVWQQLAMAQARWMLVPWLLFGDPTNG